MFNNWSKEHSLQKLANICFTKLAYSYSLMFLFLTMISSFLCYISRAAQCRECLNSQKKITKKINNPMT